LAWSFVLSWLLMQIVAGITHAWQRSGLEFGAPPQPVGTDDEASATQESAPPEEDEARFMA
jgi:hypothetical protein